MTRTISLVAAFVLLGASAAFAGKTVEYDRASLDRADYVESVFRQIYSAAKKQCIREKTDAPLGLRYRNACKRDAIDAAVAEINHPKLTAYANNAVRTMMVGGGQ